MSTKVMFHGCVQGFQDDKYGVQQRVFNQMQSGVSANIIKWRCTACGGTVETMKKKVATVLEKGSDEVV